MSSENVGKSANTSRKANRLADSVSPYLLQHAHNPVDWHPWGAEAIEKSRRENKPIFLSIGYSACHWCHVMEREVFENEKIAELMNAHFVNIKVDREERPDLDEVYMLATQLLTGSGGWPMSVWLTPALEPFYAGTYFPPVDGYGRPGFPRVLLALSDAWKNRNGALLEQAAKVVEAARHRADETQRHGSGEAIALGAALAGAIEQWADGFDAEHGGIGDHPKFPPHQALALWTELLRRGERSGVSKENLAAVKEMTIKTLDGMCRGGIYDHVGGAFARYSTDARWLVPHFEKMLYDNAQLAPVYAQAGVLFGREDYKHAARETLDFYLREMVNAEGAFYSTLDADSEGVEGKYYVWTAEQIHAAVGEQDAKLIAEYFGVTQAGNWDEGHEAWNAGANVLELVKAAEGEVRKRIDFVLAKLRDERSKRVPPGLDDKVLTSWNGLMISALAVSGRELGERKYIDAAGRAAEFLVNRHMKGGKLLRVSRGGGEAHTAGFLEDYAYLLLGLVDLMEADAAMAEKFAPHAVWLANVIVKDFQDEEGGGFFFTGIGHEKLFVRMKVAMDNATPSANATAIAALLRMAQITGEATYRQAAMRGARSFSAIAERGPSLVPTLLKSLVIESQYTGAGALAETADHQEGVVMVEAPNEYVVKAGGILVLPLTVKIAAGYHIQTNLPHEKEALATVARARGDLPMEGQQWEFPEPEEFEESGVRVRGYRGQVTITGRVMVSAEAGTGSYTVRAIVLAQACSGHSCLLPGKVGVDVRVEVE